MIPAYTSRVPGKALLLGEYAVLHGGLALVAAVGRYARVRPLAKGEQEDGHIKFVRRSLAGELAWREGTPLRVDSSEFFLQGTKLGLGSSSALVAAVATELARQNDQDPSREDVRRRLLPSAVKIHNRFQGFDGSGADVAACLFGGFLLVRPRDSWLLPFVLPAETEIVFCWTGQSSSTRDMLELVDSWRRRCPDAWETIMGRMCGIVAGLLEPALEAGRFVQLVREYEEALQSLSDESKAPIVTPIMRELIEVARALGGAAKPSGAGGGDILLATFTNAVAACKFRGACTERGTPPIEMAIDFQGAQTLVTRSG